MNRKTKEESLDLFYFKDSSNNKPTKKVSNNMSKKKKTNKKINNKNKEKNTKEEKFNFDDEIIIGLKRIDDEETKTKGNKNGKNKGVGKNTKKSTNKKNVKSNNKKENKQKESVLTPKQELTRKKRKAIFKLMKWTTLLLIVIGGSIYTLLSPIFNIKTISITGNAKLSIDEIVSLSKIELEQNMFKYRKEDIINNIKENAYIDTVKVSRKFPDTIELEVSERSATFMIKFANAYAFINNQGYILEITDKKQDLPTITGIQTKQEDIQTGNRLCTEDLKRLEDVLKIMESAVSNNINDLITQIDITNHDDYKLILQKKKKIVYLGDTSNLSTKMLWIIKFNELEGDTQGEIMLNMNLNEEKNKPYFRSTI